MDAKTAHVSRLKSKTGMAAWVCRCFTYQPLAAILSSHNPKKHILQPCRDEFRGFGPSGRAPTVPCYRPGPIPPPSGAAGEDVEDTDIKDTAITAHHHPRTGPTAPQPPHQTGPKPPQPPHQTGPPPPPHPATRVNQSGLKGSRNSIKC